MCVCFFLPLFPPTRQFKSSFSPLLCVIWLYSNPGTINPPVSFHYSCMGAPSRPRLPPAPPLISSPLPHLLLPSFYCFSGIDATEEAHHITSATTILRLMGPIVVTGSYAAFRTSDDRRNRGQRRRKRRRRNKKRRRLRKRRRRRRSLL